ncbi:hypothetical protein JL916_04595 [Staphylococcus pseudintermedius]|uniref:Phage protein n=2 Tax=Staphylococcus pseudintermedius TaxID=283734 RepID=A0A8H9BYA3_STAPS|nr:hypothetical protein [Staphylococcus pseudintermedius]EGQ0303239.1 hypothetical protein [Staphylococcus pseudintermedius]EGQ1625193.1 hypothetical protein [Staphylococcus pseudintermedius]EGQ1664856.1 hypothetical protein [Staphylococcus pseudintermedius]EGQ1687219.1 hypothetical protein [Staphylococcus pseudintermedius]EGQ1735052.1 hypothetical protein [Staphylococcus pseudintermedius]
MTEFNLIYDKFLSKITDFSYAQLDKETLEEDLKKKLIQALAYFTQLEDKKAEYVDNVFISDLSVLEQEILANIMVINHLDKFIVSEDNMRILLNSKDYKQYSQATLLKELKSTKAEYQSDVEAMKNAYSFRNKFRKKDS